MREMPPTNPMPLTKLDYCLSQCGTPYLVTEAIKIILEIFVFKVKSIGHTNDLITYLQKYRQHLKDTYDPYSYMPVPPFTNYGMPVVLANLVSRHDMCLSIMTALWCLLKVSEDAAHKRNEEMVKEAIERILVADDIRSSHCPEDIDMKDGYGITEDIEENKHGNNDCKC